MEFHIRSFEPGDTAGVLELSMRAWAPVFENLKPAVLDYVYDAFYPEGWRARQTNDVGALLKSEGSNVFVASSADGILGYVGIRLHREDNMGEVYILAVDPEYQRHGVATALLDFATSKMRDAGMAIVMVETGGDPGHAPSRATYESAGFERWPVARYFRKL